MNMLNMVYIVLLSLIINDMLKLQQRQNETTVVICANSDEYLTCIVARTITQL